MSAFWQDLLAETVGDQRAAELLEEARQRFDRAVAVPCPFGNCTLHLDPVDGTVHSSFGPVGCGCDILPGGSSPYYDQRPKRGWAGKARGRHGSRVQRSRARRARVARRWADLDFTVDVGAP